MAKMIFFISLIVFYSFQVFDTAISQQLKVGDSNTTIAISTKDQPSEKKSHNSDVFGASLDSTKTKPWTVEEMYTYSFGYESTVVLTFAKRINAKKQIEYFLGKTINGQREAFVKLTEVQYKNAVTKLTELFKEHSSSVCYLPLTYSEQKGSMAKPVTLVLCNETLSEKRKEQISTWYREQNDLLIDPKLKSKKTNK